jgi:hypothetical protein
LEEQQRADQRAAQQPQPPQQPSRPQQPQQQPRPATSNTVSLVTPAGKAWVIQDNQVQGSGKAIVFTADGKVEGYERILGIWRPRLDNTYSTTTYTATGTRVIITSNDSYYNTYAGNYNYTISGSTLSITGDNPTAGRYTLADLPSVPAPGGNIVPPSGMGWFRNGRQEIYNAEGFYNVYLSNWSYTNWGTYTINQSTGKLTTNTQNKSRPVEYNYSVTDFGNGNMTLRIWIYAPRNIGPTDEVYRLQAYPSGTQLPRTR